MSKDGRRSKYLVFGQPRFGEDEINAVVETLRSGWIGTGPRSKQFESEFAKYQGVSSAAAVSSCTAALTLALQAYGIKQGDEVITTAMTFAATINAIIHTGATPILVDISADSQNIDVAQVAAAITPRTKAVIPVHFAGEAADVDALLALGREHRIKIIHDCAHAIETEYKGKRLGSYGDASCFSFYSTKNITTIEGGMVCSEDSSFIDRVRLLSNHGLSKDAWKRFSEQGYQHYDVVQPGFKHNFTDVHAALGLVQLKSIGEFHVKRAAIWKTYLKELSDLPLALPRDVPKDQRHAFHLFTIRVDESRCGITRDEMLTRLHALGIGCGVHYRAIPQMTYYREVMKWDPAQFPNATRLGDQTISLPLTPYLTAAEVKRVISAVREVLGAAAAGRRAA